MYHHSLLLLFLRGSECNFAIKNNDITVFVIYMRNGLETKIGLCLRVFTIYMLKFWDTRGKAGLRINRQNIFTV